jgi:hypothetical protein
VEHPRAQVPEIDDRDLVLEGGSRKGPPRRVVKAERQRTHAFRRSSENRVSAGGTDDDGKIPSAGLTDKDDKRDNRNRR